MNFLYRSLKRRDNIPQRERKTFLTINGFNEKINMKILFSIIILSALLTNCSEKSSENSFEDQFPKNIKRTWIGPQYWTNRLQDWRLNNGRIECIKAGPNRNVNLLTVRTGNKPGAVIFSVRLGLSNIENIAGKDNWLGWRIGIKGQFDDYRDDAIYGSGLNVGITTAGNLFIGSPPIENGSNSAVLLSHLQKGIILKLCAADSAGVYNLSLQALDENGKVLAAITNANIPAKNIAGAIALVSHFPKAKMPIDGYCSWFDDLEITGEKIALFPQRKYGPILFEQYTLSRGILKMTAQLPPVAKTDGHEVMFQIKKDNLWQTLQKQLIDSLSFTATFKIKGWDNKKSIPYRLVYRLNTTEGLKPYYWKGTIRKESLDKDEVVLAAFTGNNDLGFPNNDLVSAVKFHNPDMFFFSGDQIYEGVGGYGAQRAPFNKAVLDYLRKWYLFGWAYGELLRDRPCVSIPDDHDVYHGNVWGDSGKATPKGLCGFEAQDAGGYKMPAEWVKMVQRTQTSHLPDPYDPRPVLQGIGVYYTELNYGGISFAILEDRKFKSAPKPLLPEAQINNGWYQNRSWNPVTQGDAPGARLLGRRQLDFLEHWADDWSNRTWMKAVLSQTIFANVATLPQDAYHDNVVPKLRILHKGEYPPDDRPVADMDSDGWPQTGRNKAVKAIRKAFALHIAGDQHLATIFHHGIDDWNDANYSFCAPSIANYYLRWWKPLEPGKNRAPGQPEYLGEFLDGFNNKITLHAVANPSEEPNGGDKLTTRAAGFGVVRFDVKSRKITMECWPRHTDIGNPEAQYEGWPKTIDQLDNYGRKAAAWLPELRLNRPDQVVQVIDEESLEIVYTLRIKGQNFRPKVFHAGQYSIRVGEGSRMKTITNVSALADQNSFLDISL